MSWDTTWESIFSAVEWGKYPSEDVIRFVARNYYSRDRKQVKFLEVGCGPGANIWFFAREGFNAHGVEGSATAIKRCQERLDAEGLTATLHAGDVGKLPYPDGFFDAVFDVECIYCNNYGSSRAIITEIARVLKSGGKFYSRTFAEDRFMGTSPTKLGHLEYSAVHEGGLKGKGFVRLTDRPAIDDLYGSVLTIENVERVTQTRDNQKQLISEWQITCSKA